MTVYYFDVRDGDRISPDYIGQDVDSMASAALLARQAATRVGQEVLAKGKIKDVAVLVRDADNNRVLTVTLTLQVEAHSM